MMLEREEQRAEAILAHRRGVEPARIGQRDPARGQGGVVDVLDSGARPRQPAQSRRAVQAARGQFAEECLDVGQIGIRRRSVVAAAGDRRERDARDDTQGRDPLVGQGERVDDPQGRHAHLHRPTGTAVGVGHGAPGAAGGLASGRALPSWSALATGAPHVPSGRVQPARSPLRCSRCTIRHRPVGGGTRGDQGPTERGC